MINLHAVEFHVDIPQESAQAIFVFSRDAHEFVARTFLENGKFKLKNDFLLNKFN